MSSIVMESSEGRNSCVLHLHTTKLMHCDPQHLTAEWYCSSKLLPVVKVKRAWHLQDGPMQLLHLNVHNLVHGSPAARNRPLSSLST